MRSIMVNQRQSTHVVSSITLESHPITKQAGMKGMRHRKLFQAHILSKPFEAQNLSKLFQAQNLSKSFEAQNLSEPIEAQILNKLSFLAQNLNNKPLGTQVLLPRQ